MSRFNGFLNILKPPGMTSHDVVYKVRKLLPSKIKVGHLGTLDPAATGVLPIAVGRATRLISLIPSGCDVAKAYHAELKFGVSTFTDDLEGEVLKRRDLGELKDWSLKRWQQELSLFVGEIEQVPPRVSAVRKGGVRAYDAARSGRAMELSARPVSISQCRALSWQPQGGLLRLFLVCSAGTYVRALARDLGEKLNTGGALSFLIRTLSGSFDLAQAVTIEELALNGLSAHLLDERFPFLNLPTVSLRLESKGQRFSGDFLPGKHYLASNGLLLGLEQAGCGRVEAVFSDGDS